MLSKANNVMINISGGCFCFCKHWVWCKSVCWCRHGARRPDAGAGAGCAVATRADTTRRCFSPSTLRTPTRYISLSRPFTRSQCVLERYSVHSSCKDLQFNHEFTVFVSASSRPRRGYVAFEIFRAPARAQWRDVAWIHRNIAKVEVWSINIIDVTVPLELQCSCAGAPAE